MSAQAVLTREAPRIRQAPAPTRPWLRAIQGDAKSITRIPFLVVMSCVLAGGMVGLLLLNTTLQNQAFQLRSLQKQANDLGYKQAMLQGQVDRANSPEQLGSRAAALGMVPNPHPAYLRLADGRISGSAVAVTGTELPAITAAARARAANMTEATGLGIVMSTTTATSTSSTTTANARPAASATAVTRVGGR